MHLEVHLVHQLALPPGEEGAYTKDELSEHYDVYCDKDSPRKERVLGRLITDIIRHVRGIGGEPQTN